MKNDRSFLIPGQKKQVLDEKKALEVIASLLGTIRAHVPETEADFVQSLRVNRPKLYDHAVEKGVIVREVPMFPFGADIIDPT